MRGASTPDGGQMPGGGPSQRSEGPRRWATGRSTASIVASDQRHHLHPFQLFDTYLVDPALAVARGAGARLVDTDGNEYLDAVGGMWCTNIGLGREEMAAAIAEQVRDLAYANPFTDMTNVCAVELAERLASLAPGSLNHAFFTCGGSTANDAALRLVQFYWAVRDEPKRRHILSRVDSYHGTTLAAASLSGKPGDRVPEFQFITETIHHLSSPNHYRYGRGRAEQEFADDLIAELEAKVDGLGGPGHVAALFAEPVMGSGGVIMPPADYLQRMWEFCRRHGILYVSDEVVTGFGRLGEWFVSESLYGIRPDILTTAKGLTSGYVPLGAMLFTDEIFDVISEPGQGRCFAVGYTYSAHPVSCAAALKNIEIIEREDLLQHVRSVGPYFMEQLATLADLPMVGDVRGFHLMACVEFVADRADKRPYPEELAVGKRVSNQADALGLIVRPIENLNVMSPPLVITHDDVDAVVNRLREAIIAARAELDAAGHG